MGVALVCVSGGVGVVSCLDPVISLGGCVQGVGTRVARMGGRCAVVWLASEWQRVVCAVCVACGTQGGPLFMHKVPVSHCPVVGVGKEITWYLDAVICCSLGWRKMVIWLLAT